MSAGIIIIPGFFNPPAEAIQKMRLETWPVTPARGLARMEDQWQSMPTFLEEILGVGVNYVRRNFTTGDIAIGVTDYMEGLTNFETLGVRYLTDRNYPKTGEEPGGKYLSDGALIDIGFAPASPLSFFPALKISRPGGMSAVKRQACYINYNWSVYYTGIDDGSTYVCKVNGVITPSGGSGSVRVHIAIQGPQPYYDSDGNLQHPTVELDNEIGLTAELFRDGSLIERVDMARSYIGMITYEDMEGDASAEPDLEIHPGTSWHVDLFGPSAASTPAAHPGSPISRYARECWLDIGTAKLS